MSYIRIMENYIYRRQFLGEGNIPPEVFFECSFRAESVDIAWAFFDDMDNLLINNPKYSLVPNLSKPYVSLLINGHGVILGRT